jgi:integrase
MDAQIANLIPVSSKNFQRRFPSIRTFCGLRTSELLSLEWAQVTETEIIVKGQNAKTRQRRVVSISENLQAWLKPYRKASKSKGSVLSY